MDNQVLHTNFTGAQLAKAKAIVQTEGVQAKDRLLREVFEGMEPPENISRTFDSYSRIQMYNGYRSGHLVNILIKELA